MDGGARGRFHPWTSSHRDCSQHAAARFLCSVDRGLHVCGSSRPSRTFPAAPLPGSRPMQLLSAVVLSHRAGPVLF